MVTDTTKILFLTEMFYGGKHWASLKCKLDFLKTIIFNDIMEMNFPFKNKDMSCIIMGIVQCISVVLAVFIKNTIFRNLRRKSTIFDQFLSFK